MSDDERPAPGESPGVGSARPRRRNALVATLLALVSPILAYLYVGRPRRVLLYLGAVVLALAVPVALAWRGLWIPGVPWWLLPLVVSAIAIIDSIGIAKRHVGHFVGSWYSRWYGLVGVGLAFIVVSTLIRTFGFETFHVPSGSMMPTLLIGDIFVSTPYADHRPVRRGDIIVFHYPPDPATLFVQRVVGVPGDRVAYYSKRLYINGTEVEQEIVGTYAGSGPGSAMTGASHRSEILDGRSYEVLTQSGYPSIDGKLVVPDGHYFVLGDNRDNSRDSRYWGTVPRELILGRARLIWWNTSIPHRAGRALE